MAGKLLSYSLNQTILEHGGVLLDLEQLEILFGKKKHENS